MEKKDLNISRGVIPGYENGHYESARNYDRSELKQYSLEDPTRRDSRINIRLSGSDMEQLHKLSLAEGVPSQSLLASIVHRYVNGLLVDMPISSSEKPAVRNQKSLNSPACNK
jgi:predicted DNA binding CopG/RHH family protein